MIEDWLQKCFDAVRNLATWPGDNLHLEQYGKPEVSIDRLLRVISWVTAQKFNDPLKNIEDDEQRLKAVGLLALRTGGAACGEMGCANYALLTEGHHTFTGVQSYEVFVVQSLNHTICCVDVAYTGTGGGGGWILDAWYPSLTGPRPYSSLVSPGSVRDQSLIPGMVGFQPNQGVAVKSGASKFGATQGPVTLSDTNADLLETAVGSINAAFLKTALEMQDAMNRCSEDDLRGGLLSYELEKTYLDKKKGRQVPYRRAVLDKLKTDLHDAEWFDSEHGTQRSVAKLLGRILADCKPKKAEKGINVANVAAGITTDRYARVRATLEKIAQA